MYPYINEYFFKHDIPSFTIMLVTAVLAALVSFRIFATKTKMPTGAYNFYLLNGVLSIGAGFMSAFLFQAIYNYAETGKFKLQGITVMGGILGAAIFFILFTLIGCSTKIGKKYKSSFWTAVNLIIPCIVIAQCIGRIGCFLGGCCYGKETDGVFGILFVDKITTSGSFIYHDHERLPTQLFESIFMLLLFVAMVLVMFKFKKKNLTALMYLYAYPIFRFIIEFFRDDSRGASFLGMSPSQVQSIGLLLVGITLTILIYRFGIIPFNGKNKGSPTGTKEETLTPKSTTD